MGSMCTTVAVQWNICGQCGRHIHLGAYANNVKYIYSSVAGHIIVSSVLIWGIYFDLLVSYLYMN